MAPVIFKFAGMNTLADPASIDTLNPKSAQYGQCVDLVNLDLDDEHNATTRDGCTLAFTGAVTSCWTSAAGVTYCVYGGYLCTFDGTNVTPLTTAFTVQAACEFEQLNDVVVFSDNAKIGIISGSTVTRIDTPANWVDVATLDQWVASHMPANPANWNGTTSNSNFEVDAFALATKAGKCLHHFNGALYLAINNFVYVTKTHHVEKMDIRYSVVAGFPDNVTMIKHVADGLFVGTAAACYFLAGTGIVVDADGKIKERFKQTQVSPYGVAYGTSLAVSAELIPDLRTKDPAVLWASPVGVFAGLPGGAAVNLSADKVSLGAITSGVAIVKESTGLKQYVVCSNGGAWVLNLNKLTHSRYTDYPYTSLFKRGSYYYGVDSLAIVRFGGDVDYVTSTGLTKTVDAYALTPSTNLGTGNTKHLRKMFTRVRRNAVQLAIDVIVDEVVKFTSGSVAQDASVTAHTASQKVPRGLKGVYWQFKFRNKQGGRFTVLDIEPAFEVSATRTK